MSDTSAPAEKPVNDGGGNAPQDPEPEGQEASAAGAEKPVNDGGGS